MDGKEEFVWRATGAARMPIRHIDIEKILKTENMKLSVFDSQK